MEIKISYYKPGDYQGILNLYTQESTFGGQYDDARDTEEKLNTLSQMKIWSILVAKINEKIVGTITLFEDSRAAWLYRFAVQEEHEIEISDLLNKKAIQILKEKGHSQVLVYAPKDNIKLEKRYKEIGFNKGGNYTCFWREI
jgi:hypothetical protein